MSEPIDWGECEFDSHYGVTKTFLHIDYKGRVYVGSEGGSDGDKGVCLNESHDYGVLHSMIALANHALPDDDPRKITREWVAALRAAPEWIAYLDSGECPKCGGGGFKMSAPPICTTCGWKLAVHPQTMETVFAEMSAALESYLPPK